MTGLTARFTEAWRALGLASGVDLERLVEQLTLRLDQVFSIRLERIVPGVREAVADLQAVKRQLQERSEALGVAIAELRAATEVLRQVPVLRPDQVPDPPGRPAGARAVGRKR